MHKIRFGIILLAISFLLTSCARVTDPEKIFAGQSAEKIYTGGEQALAKREYHEANQHFEGLEVLYPFSQYSEQAKLDSIYSYYKDGDLPSAVASADSFIRLYPASPHADYAYYMKGVAQMFQTRSFAQTYLPVDISTRDQTSAKLAYQTFTQLITLYPNSFYAPDARQRMVYLRNIFAEHDLRIAQFNYKHHAYVGAVNRANEILRHYQGSPAIEGALVVQIEAYRQLHMFDMAQKSLDLLKQYYPRNPLL